MSEFENYFDDWEINYNRGFSFFSLTKKKRNSNWFYRLFSTKYKFHCYECGFVYYSTHVAICDLPSEDRIALSDSAYKKMQEYRKEYQKKQVDNLRKMAKA